MGSVDFDTYIHIAELLNNKLSQAKIAKIVGVSQTTVFKYSQRLKEEPITDNEIEKYKWLKKHWNFTGKTIGNDKYIGTHKNGYRVVRKGDKGHLRTPYRADYRFR